MIKTFIIFLISTSVFAAPPIQKGEKYESYTIQLTAEKPVLVTVSQKVLTDGCNDYSLIPNLHSTRDEHGYDQNVFVFEPWVISTEIGCPPDTKPVYQTIESEVLEFTHTRYMDVIKILVPESVTIKFN